MPYNGSGIFQLVSGNPVVTGTLISSTWANNTLADIANDGLTNCLTRDGQTTPTANIPMGGFNLTSLGAPTGTGQALRWEALAKGPSIAAAATISVPTEGSMFDVTGTTGITAINDTFSGKLVYLRFTGTLTITNSASLKLPGGQNITTTNGDVAIFLNTEPGVWECVYYAATSTSQRTNIQTFTSNGSYVVPGVTTLYYRGCAAGGGGGGAAGFVGTSSQLHGGGGGAGQSAEWTALTVVPGETLTIQIGAAGTGGPGGAASGAGTAGVSGGVTRILRGATVLVTLTGGTGGNPGSAGGPAAGGVGFPNGGDGQAVLSNVNSQNLLLYGGAGGSSMYGGGGQSLSALALSGRPGNNAGGFGGGGSGGNCPTTSSATGGGGGNGTQGFLQVAY